MPRTITGYNLGVKIDVAGTAAKTELAAIDRKVASLHRSFRDLGSARGIGNIAGSLTGLSGTFTAIAAGGAAAIAITTAAGVALFNLAKSASDYGSDIYDASQKTGLGAETLSALKIAADQSSGSMEMLSAGIKIFSKTVAEASRGSDEAKDKLRRLGIDPQDAIRDLQGAVAKAFKTINDAPEGILQTNAALDAFGRSGSELIPTIRSFDGDLAGLIARAKDLGATLTDEEAAAADHFGDTLDTLGIQVRALGYKFAREFMPAIQTTMDKASGWLKTHQDTAKQWGQNVGSFIEGATKAIEKEMAKSDRGLKSNAQQWEQHGKTAGQSILTTVEALGTLASAIAAVTREWQDYFSEWERQRAQAEKDNVPRGTYGEERDSEGRPIGPAGDSRGLRVRPAAPMSPLREPAGPGVGMGSVALNPDGSLANRAAIIAANTRGSSYDVGDTSKGGGAGGDATAKKTAEAIKLLEVRQKAAKRIYDQEILDANDNAEKIAAAETKLNLELKQILKERRELELKAAKKDEGLRIISEAAEEELQLEANKTKALAALDAAAAKDSIALLFQTEDRKEELASMADDRAFARIEDNEARKLTTHELAEDQRNFIVEAGFKRRREMLERELNATKDDAKAQAEIQHKLDLLSEEETAGTEEHERRKRAAKQKTADEIEEHHNRQLKLWDAEIAARERLWEQQQREAEEARRERIRSQEAEGGGLGGGLPSLVGSTLEEIQTIGAMGVATQNVANIALDALSSMGQALGNMVGQWTLLGNVAGQSMRKMAASVLAGVATQAIALGAFHFAIGLVALTPWGAALYGPAVLWFKSAALMFALGAGAAGLGRLAAGGGGGAGEGSQSAEAANQALADENNPANQFASRNAGAGSSSRNALPGDTRTSTEQALTRIADALDRLESAPAEDWLRMGAKRAPEVIGEANAAALASDPALVNRHGRLLNLE